MKTKNGLEFSLEEPKLEATDRNISGTELFKLSNDNEIINLEYIKEYEFKTFGASINNNGIVKIHYTGKKLLILLCLCKQILQANLYFLLRTEWHILYQHL